MNGTDQRKRVGDLGVYGRHNANECGEKRRSISGILPTLMQFKGGLQRLKPRHVRNPFGDQHALVHKRGHQFLPPCVKQMLLVIGRLRGDGAHQWLGFQDALPRFDEKRIGRGKQGRHDGRMRRDNRLITERIEAVDQPLLLRGLDMKLGFLNCQHKRLSGFRSRLAKLHEQKKALQGDKTRALPLRGKGRPRSLNEVRHDAF